MWYTLFLLPTFIAASCVDTLRNAYLNRTLSVEQVRELCLEDCSLDYLTNHCETAFAGQLCPETLFICGAQAMIKRRYEILNAEEGFTPFEASYVDALVGNDVVDASFGVQPDDELLSDVEELLTNLDNAMH